LIYANQDRNLAESLELAQADFAVRQDIYTYDVLAWALYKNRRYREAGQASKEALKLGAPEALIFYHAGMISQALGDADAARTYLHKALELNPGFDVRQASRARETLATMGKESE
jgi:tetratricopeptide (TPR) repeat protein